MRLHPLPGSANPLQAPTGGQDLKIAADNRARVNTDLDGQPPADGPEVASKKHSHLVNLDVLRVSPLDQDHKDGANVAKGRDDADTGTDVKSVNTHRLATERSAV